MDICGRNCMAPHFNSLAPGRFQWNFSSYFFYRWLKYLLWNYPQVVVTGKSDTWWRHQMETFSAQLAICAGNSPVPGEFPAQRPVTRSFDVFSDLYLNRRFRKQSWGRWFETLSRPLWRHCNVKSMYPRINGHVKTYRTLITVMSWRARWLLKSPVSRLFAPPSAQAQIKDNIKALRD